MSDENPTLQDMWRLLGSMNRRFGERFDAMDRQFVVLREEMAGLRAEVRSEVGGLSARMIAGFGALKESIEARDFRLDEHGRRLTEIESRLPDRS